MENITQNPTTNTDHPNIRDTVSIKDASIPNPIKKLSSTILFAGAKELVIAHDGQEYRLRQTQQGKLILTK